MTFVDEPDRYSQEIYPMCENELRTSKFSNVIVLQPANKCVLVRRKPDAARRLHEFMFYTTGVIADQSFTLREYVNMNFIVKALKSYRLTDRRTNSQIHVRPKLYTTPLRGWSIKWLCDMVV